MNNRDVNQFEDDLDGNLSDNVEGMDEEVEDPTEETKEEPVFEEAKAGVAAPKVNKNL